MKKNIIKVWDLPSAGTNLVLIILAITFFIGILAGGIFAAQVDGIGNDAMNDYLLSYLSGIDTYGFGFLTSLWDAVQWPIFILILGLTPVGLLGIPVLFVIRGFLLAFSVASFYIVFDLPGLLMAAAVFGITGLIYIPVLFILGVQSFLSSGTMTSRLLGETKHQPLLGRTYFVRIGICAVILCVCCFIECNLIPAILKGLADLIK